VAYPSGTCDKPQVLHLRDQRGTSTLPHPPISLAEPPPPAAQVGTQTAHAVGWRSIGASTAAVKGRM